MEEKDIKKAPQQEGIKDIINITDFDKNFNKTNELELKFYSMKELKKAPFKTKWLIENFFIRQGIGILHSLPGIGKTWWALKFCECIATGHIFANQYKVRKGKCLYIGAEDFKGIANRLNGIEEIIQTDSNFSDKEIKNFKKNITVVEISKGALELQKYERVKLNSGNYRKLPTNAIYLYNRILEFNKHFDFIVIDTLARTFNDSVNNDLVGQQYMDAIEWLSKSLNCFILLISHESKSAEFRNTTMGTTKFTASADIELGTDYFDTGSEKSIKEKQAKIKNNEHSKLLKLYCTKPPKHGNEPEQICMKIRAFYSNKYKDELGKKMVIARLDKDPNPNLYYTLSQSNNAKKLKGEEVKEFKEDIEELKPMKKSDKVLNNSFKENILD